MKRVAVVGCRPPRAELREAERHSKTWHCIVADVLSFLRRLRAEDRHVVLVSGGARGVDTVARLFAEEHDLEIVEHLPDYDAHSWRAPLVRNTLIVENSDEVHAWPAPWSRGTWDTVNKARAASKPTHVHEPFKKP